MTDPINGQLPSLEDAGSTAERPHQGVKMTGHDGADGPKAFYIQIEAQPGKGEEVAQMLSDILDCVQEEPATGPWYGVRYSDTAFAIFEAFPDIAGRQAHVEGGGGDIFRDVDRMNSILARPAHVHKVDILLRKEVFAR
jgi:quinol monooxygenase YgiN